MNNIGDLFSKVFKKLQKHKISEDIIISVIKDSLNIDLSRDNFTVKDSKILLHTHPLITQEIYIHKDKILSLLQNKGVEVTDLH